MRWALAVVLAGPLWACGEGAPSSPEGSGPAASDSAGFFDCPTADCRLAAAPAQWQHDPGPLLAWLPSAPPLEQLGVFRAVSAQDPEGGRALCKALPADSPNGVQCRTVMQRPHLDAQVHADLGTELRSKSRAGAGPPGGHLPPPLASASDPPDPSRALPPPVCPQAPDPRACSWSAAAERALQGDLVGAGLVCRAEWASDERERDECLFRTAEALAGQYTLSGLRDGGRMCADNHWFGAMCTQHLLARHAVRAASVAGGPAAADIAQTLAAVAGEPTLGSWYADAFWSRHLAELGSRDPDVLQSARWPAEAAGQVRFARALVHLSWLPEDSLDASAAGMAALAARRMPDPARLLRAHNKTRAIRSFDVQYAAWNLDLPGEGALPSAALMGLRRRTVHPDPAVDWEICVLEAAAMRKPAPPPAYFFEQVGPERAEAVRWTAARLGRSLYPDHVGNESDPSPLVQGRLAWRGVAEEQPQR